jgi:hypothetical protein
MYESAIQFEDDLSFIFLVSILFFLPVGNYSVRGVHIGLKGHGNEPDFPRFLH